MFFVKNLQDVKLKKKLFYKYTELFTIVNLVKF